MVGRIEAPEPVAIHWRIVTLRVKYHVFSNANDAGPARFERPGCTNLAQNDVPAACARDRLRAVRRRHEF